MPGFGPLDCSSEELAALVDRIVGGVREAVQSLPEQPIESADSSAELHQLEATGVSGLVEPPDAAERPTISVAAQPAVADRSADLAEPVRRRMHGGALPS
jgi:hypothetical protein